MKDSQSELGRILANRALVTLKDLFNGTLTENGLTGAPMPSQALIPLEDKLEPAGRTGTVDLGREISLNALRLSQLLLPVPEEAERHGALARLCGDHLAVATLREESAQPGRWPAASTADAGPTRGAIWPLSVEAVDLPGRDEVPIELAGFCPKAAELFSRIERYMMAPDGEEKIARSDVKPYSDPALQRRGCMLDLAARLWCSNMLREVQEARMEVDIFSVVKKVVDGVPRLRLIFDLRRINLLFRTPPYVALSGPSCLAGLDFGEVPPELEFQIATGDVPNWFYRLGIPQELSELFALRGVTTKELRALLVQRGLSDQCRRLPDPELGGRLGCAVVLMGWSWGVWLAEAALEALVHPVLSPDRQLVHGAPLPRFTANEMHAYWLYIDDFGVLGFVEKGGKDVIEKRDAITAAVKSAGFGVHKEESGEEGVSVGITVGGRPPVARPILHSLWVLIFATDELLEMELTSPRIVSIMVGQWTWRMLLARSTLSVFDEVYKFIHAHGMDDVVSFPLEVKLEFAGVRNLAPYMRSELALPWSERVFMTDASPTGGAVVQTTADLDEIKQEAAWGTPGTWLVLRPERSERAYDETLDTTEQEEEGGSQPGQRIPKAVKLRLLRFLHLFSGPRRPDDLEDWLVKLGAESGILVIVDVADLETSPPVDVLDPAAQEEIFAKGKADYWDAGHGGPACATWSAALFNPGPGFPEPYRSRDQPWGLPTLTGRRSQRVEDANEMLIFTLNMFAIFSVVGAGWTLEHPQDRGRHPYPSIWVTHPVLELETTAGASRVHFDQCMLGAPSRKPTTLMGTLDGLNEFRHHRCCHRDHGVVLRGKDEDGRFRTTPAARYPSAMCKLLAELHLQTMLRHRDARFVDDEELDEGASKATLNAEALADAVKVKIPEVSATWDRRERWSEVFRMRWARREASNVIELRVITALLQHLARAASSMRRRFLILTDNLAALAVLMRGRTSARSMRGAARKAAAISLSSGLRFVLRWVPSGRNWADGPSRQRNIQEEIHVKPVVEEMSTASALGALSNAQMRDRCRKVRTYHG